MCGGDQGRERGPRCEPLGAEGDGEVACEHGGRLDGPAGASQHDRSGSHGARAESPVDLGMGHAERKNRLSPLKAPRGQGHRLHVAALYEPSPDPPAIEWRSP
jgi:hypothetical protein